MEDFVGCQIKKHFLNSDKLGSVKGRFSLHNTSRILKNHLLKEFLTSNKHEFNIIIFFWRTGRLSLLASAEKAESSNRPFDPWRNGVFNLTLPN
jgi:hypothetical protein